MGTLWDGLGPDMTFTVIHGITGDTIATLPLWGNRYRAPSFIEKDFPEQMQAISLHLSEMEAPDSEELAAPLNIPAVTKAIALNRPDTERPLHVLMMGNPFYAHTRDPGVSMISADGVPRIPSDAFVVEDKTHSPYGRGEDDPDLSGAVFHICADLPDNLLEAEERDVARFWGHYLGQRGGSLVTFTSDLNGCVAAFEAKKTTPLPFTPLDPTAPLEMRVLIMDSAPPVDEVDPRSYLFAADLARQEAYIAQCDAAIDALETFQPDEDNGLDIDSFMRFITVPHPKKDGFSVMTGINYDAQNFPAWTSAFCYTRATNAQGSDVRLDLGDQSVGGEINWLDVQTGVLKDVSLSKRFVRQARDACRFPGDAA